MVKNLGNICPWYVIHMRKKDSLDSEHHESFKNSFYSLILHLLTLNVHPTVFPKGFNRRMLKYLGCLFFIVSSFLDNCMVAVTVFEFL